MKCDLCGFESIYIQQFRHPDHKNDNWNSEDGSMSVIHCPKCGDKILLYFCTVPNPKKEKARKHFYATSDWAKPTPLPFQWAIHTDPIGVPMSLYAAMKSMFKRWKKQDDIDLPPNK